MRASIAIVVAVAFAGGPLALDLCAASCDAASKSASVPPCHHSSVPGDRIGGTPTPCGHDHNATFATATTEATPAAKTLNTATTTTVILVIGLAIVQPLHAPFASPPRDPLSRHLSASLRI